MDFTRRDWIRLSALPLGAGFSACGRKRSPRYQGYALIANQESRTLAVIDLSRFQTLKVIPLEIAPSQVIAAPRQARAYIVSVGATAIQVLNLDNMQLEERIALGGRAQAACRSGDGQLLWILLAAPNALLALHAGSGKPLARAPVPHVAGDSGDIDGTGVDLDERDGCVAVAFRQARRVGCYRLAARQWRMSAALHAAPDLIRLRPDGKVLLTGNTGDRSMTAIDANSLLPLVELPLALAPKHFCFNNDGGQLFVTGDGMDAVVIVSPYQTEINETILAGNAPGCMAVTSSNPSYLLVANPASGDITVINVDNRRVLAQIPVGQEPGAVLVTPDNEYALVLNARSGDVAVLRLQSIRAASPESRRTRMASLFTLIPVGSGPVDGAVIPRAI